ncbi:glycine cleavage system protein T [Inquilinus limosus]|uniref:Glycine cleavage system protein T n=3 Tax=Inquilinus limosus TaxID=171674 RepID=A0A211Z2I6_9PROT|nr:glycine cleavage system protein T [Inquilinus limosus]
MADYTFLDRDVLRLTGEDRAAFLQGLVSNDMRKVAPGRAVFAAFLTPQGKYLHDFHVVALGDAWLIDCEAGRGADLFRRLRMYRLRSRVELADVTADWAVAAIPGGAGNAALGLPDEPGAARALADGIAHVDARTAALGARALLPKASAKAALEGLGLTETGPEAWDRLRLALGVPDGTRDLVPEKTVLLEANYDSLNAIAWDKGCYMGQELTARTRYRGLLKKRLAPVELDGPAPEPGTPILRDGREAGEMRSSRDGIGLALLRLEALEGDAGPLLAGETPVRPATPAGKAA